jgi:carboxyl-terminal processing protease
MINTGRTALILLIVIVITLALTGGCLFSRTPTPTTTSAFPESREAIDEAWDIIFANYVDQSKVDAASLSQAAIEGMLKELDDPYTSYLDAETYIMAQQVLEGTFEGIGAYVTVKDEQIMIVQPIAGSPAEKAGIRTGDIILEIDGEPVKDMSLVEAIIKIRGPEGTAVKLLVLHEGDTTPVEIEITRATLEIPSVNFEMKGGIAYINITDFTERTPDELETAIQSLTDEGATGITLDLQGNPGGLLEQVVDCASYFLSEGIVVQVRDNQGEIVVHYVNKDRPETDLPMVVLVDEDSASGSEVLAGALQDHRRATIAGTTTYGKGSVNVLYPLSDGSGLYITVARWLTPDGRLIEGQGIEPDIELEVTGDEAVQWAIDYLTGGGE